MLTRSHKNSYNYNYAMFIFKLLRHSGPLTPQYNSVKEVQGGYILKTQLREIFFNF